MNLSLCVSPEILLASSLQSRYVMVKVFHAYKGKVVPVLY
jgi:hypothetical protein